MKKILIVEDDAMIADNLSQIMTLLGYKALPVASSYHEAIQLIDKYSPDLVTLDIDLKRGKSGIDVAHYLQSKGDTPFVFITAQTGEGLMKEAAETRPCAYLPKPFTIDQIRTVLGGVLKELPDERIIQSKLYDY